MYNSPIRNNKLLHEAYLKGYRRALNEQPSIGSNAPTLGSQPRVPPTLGGPQPTLGTSRVPTGLSEPDYGLGIPPLPFGGNWPPFIIDAFNAALEAFGATIGGADIWALAADNPNFPWNLITGTVCGMMGCEDGVQLFYGGPTEWTYMAGDMAFQMVWNGTTWIAQ